MRKLSPARKYLTKGRRVGEWVFEWPRAFDNTDAVRTHSEAAEWVRPGGYLSLGTMQMYYHVTYTTLRGRMDPRRTQEFYKISGWNMKAVFCCLAGSLKGGITLTLVWNPAATKSQAVHLTNVLSSLANNSFQHLNWTDWKDLKELLREKVELQSKEKENKRLWNDRDHLWPRVS